jgi:tetrahydromethanopterin S-methyltransferase subunit G
VAEVSLELIQVMLQQVLDGQHGMRDDIRTLTRRVGQMERQVADVYGMLADHSVRMDRVAERLDRIERRLGLVEA